MRAYFKPCRYSLNVVDRHIALATLDRAEIRPVHIDVVGEILLTKTAFFPATTDIGSDDFAQLSGMVPFHPSWIARKMVIRRRVLSIICEPNLQWRIC